MLMELLKAGADPDIQDDEGITALDMAVDRGNVKLVDTLLKAGANPNTQRYGGHTPLHSAAAQGNLGIIKALLNKDADPNINSKDGYGPLHFAAEQDNSMVIKELLDAGANPNQMGGAPKEAPLMIAADVGNDHACRLLLQDKRTDPKIIKAAFNIAKQKGSKDIAQMFEAEISSRAQQNNPKGVAQVPKNKGLLSKATKIMSKVTSKVTHCTNKKTIPPPKKTSSKQKGI